ncbi:putative glycosyltransferase [Ralstonia solanacearum PSI07]|nr:putative glycosyltransferase [Ralstonia solanacearum PSI07]
MSMGIVSYAQNFEDVLLWRALQHVEHGFYIDVGAQHPVADSVSKAFYEQGWRGMHVEPVPAYADLLRSDRPDELVIQAAIADQPGLLQIFEIPDTGMSTASPEVAERHRQAGYTVHVATAPALTLDDLFGRVETEVHWLKIDVEHLEKEVLLGWRASACRPWIIVIESTYPNSQNETHQDWEPLVLAKGYTVAHADGLNRYYVSDLHPELKDALRFGPNLFDGFQVTESSWSAGVLRQRYGQQIEDIARQKQQAEQELQAARESLAQVEANWPERERALREEARQLVEAVRHEMGLHQQRLVEQEHALTEQLTQTRLDAQQAATEAVRAHAEREQALLSELAAVRQALSASEQNAMAQERQYLEAMQQAVANATTETQAHLRELIERERRFNEQIAQARLEAQQAAAAERERALREQAEQRTHAAQAHAQLQQVLDRERRLIETLSNWQREMQQDARQARLQTDSETAWQLEITTLRTQLAHAELSTAERERALREQLGHRLDTVRDEMQQHARQLAERDHTLSASMLAQQEALHAAQQQLAEWSHRIEAASEAGAALRADLGQMRLAFDAEQQTNRQQQQSLRALRQELETLRRPLLWPAGARLLPMRSQGRDDTLPPMAVPASSTADGLRMENGQPPTQGIRAATIRTVGDLLSLDGGSFVRDAYLALLGREPDSEGRDYYLGRLRQGISKLEILAQLRFSAEGAARRLHVPGLDAAMRGLRWRRLPVVGPWLRARSGRHERRLQRTRVDQASPPAMLHDETARRLAQIEQTLGDLRRLAEQRVPERNVSGGAWPADAGQPTESPADGIAPAHDGAEAEARAMASQPPAEPAAGLPDDPANLLGAAATSPPLALPLPRAGRTLYYYVDHTAQCPTNTGVQRVTRCLARALAEARQNIRFVKWDARRGELVLISRAERDHLANWNGPPVAPPEADLYPANGEAAPIVPSHALGEGNWLVVPEVPHITFHSQPVTVQLFAAARRKGLRTAFVFYDAIPLRLPELAPDAASHAAYMQQLLLADLVVPISHWSGRDLASFFHVHDKAAPAFMPRISPIPLPADFQTTPALPQRRGPTEPLILSIGTIDPRKNQAALLRAFERYCVQHPKTRWQLVLAGNLHPEVAPIVERATARFANIRYLRHVPDEELHALYERCAFTVFPSLEEGFGLPILESLRYGKPCICANFGAMHEVAQGGGCLTVDTRDDRQILHAIETLVDSPKQLQRLSREARARTFTDWADYTGQLLARLDAISSPVAQIGTVYYWVDHTAHYPGNSGIQRVVRGLARALIELGVELIPFRWDAASRTPIEATPADLEHLARWNGPPATGWARWRPPAGGNGWMLVPELTSYLPQPDAQGLREFAVAAGLRSAWVFFDVIPWKLADIYPPEATRAHEAYMAGLNRHDLVFAISRHSFQELTAYLCKQPLRTPALFERVRACSLPGEFLESSRVTQIKDPEDTPCRILCVGTVEPRKNHLALLEAFTQLVSISRTPVELIIAGGCPFPELATRLEAYVAGEPRVQWVQSPDDAELGRLYALADFTVYPSLCEGFGLPILESLWHGRPCVCASFGAMAEVAEGGGCLVTDVRDPEQLARAMQRLADDRSLRRRLAQEAVTRPFKTWRDYATEIVAHMAHQNTLPHGQTVTPLAPAAFYRSLVNLRPRPKLSVCITTYNRAAWLEVSLRNLVRLWPSAHPVVEIVVCDNASTDRTPEVVTPYLSRPDFRYVRNEKNVGMLGNLRETAHAARGEYLWILGDDDLVLPDAIEKLLQTLHDHPGLALVYLNYAYTRVADAEAVTDLDAFLGEGTPIVAPGPDQTGTVRDICARSENFFTAIYCLVFRRDHGLRAYTQNTEGPPFTTLLTCIPTTYYVLNTMMDEPACWLGEPQVLVNMNVSWLKYAPLWVLERVPEVYDTAEQLGAAAQDIDRWRSNNLPGVVHFLREIFGDDPQGNARYFSMARLVSRLKGLSGVEAVVASIREIYRQAHEGAHPAARASVEEMFAGLDRRP